MGGRYEGKFFLEESIDFLYDIKDVESWGDTQTGRRKNMKKIVSIVAVVCLALGLAACGAKVKEEKGVAVLTMEQEALKTTMTLDAKGDTVTRITQDSVISTANLTEEQIQMVLTASEQAKSSYAEIKGIEYSLEQKDGEIVEKIVIPTDKDTLQAVIKAGLLPVTDSKAEKLSVKETKKALEAAGWKVEK